MRQLTKTSTRKLLAGLRPIASYFLVILSVSFIRSFAYMDFPELQIIVLNLIIVLVAYLSIYPKLAGSNFNKISIYDVFTSGFSLLVVGLNYWGSGQEFNLLVTNTNWFWFTLITYLVIEIPVMIWYFKENKVKV
jgi:hypothetical protein